MRGFAERGDACLQSNSSLCFLATWWLSPGEAAGGRDIIAVAVCPRLCNSICECRELLLYSRHILFQMVSASLHLKGCSVPFISAYKELIVSSITLNEMLNITYLQF